MATSRDYAAKTQEYMRRARQAKVQAITMAPQHRRNLVRLTSEYVRHARNMNHEAIRLARDEDRREFLRRQADA